MKRGVQEVLHMLSLTAQRQPQKLSLLAIKFWTVVQSTLTSQKSAGLGLQEAVATPKVLIALSVPAADRHISLCTVRHACGRA